MSKDDIFNHLDRFGFDDNSAMELGGEVAIGNLDYPELSEAIDMYCASNGICIDDRNSFMSVALEYSDK